MCHQCNTSPVYEFTNKRKLCRICFVKWFEKKFLYTIRKYHMISKGDIIGIEDKNDFRTEVLKELLNLFSRKQDIKVTNKNSKKTAIPSTIDIEAENIIRDITEGKISRLKKSLPVEKIKKKTIIKPLYSFLDAEVMLYAKFKKLKFKKTEMKKNKISGLINDLEKKHPEVKRAVVNSYLKLS